MKQYNLKPLQLQKSENVNKLYRMVYEIKPI